MQLTNKELLNFISRIKLASEHMDKYRTQVKNLRERLEQKIKSDDSNGIKPIRVLIAGSWKKGTILRPTGTNPIDIDLVFFLNVPEEDKENVNKIHDAVVKYLLEIYPNKVKEDIDADLKTKAITIKFSGTGLEVDVVPVVPIDHINGFVWQPQKRWSGNYYTSVDGQLNFAKKIKSSNPSYTSVVRAIKWWKNYQELDEWLTSFTIELIVSHLEISQGIEKNIEEGIIRVFDFLSSGELKEISFPNAINIVPDYTTPIFVGDPTNNQNNTAKKITSTGWQEIQNEANKAFEALNIAQSSKTQDRTILEWKRVFGPAFNIK